MVILFLIHIFYYSRIFQILEYPDFKDQLLYLKKTYANEEKLHYLSKTEEWIQTSYCCDATEYANKTKVTTRQFTELLESPLLNAKPPTPASPGEITTTSDPASPDRTDKDRLRTMSDAADEELFEPETPFGADDFAL